MPWGYFLKESVLGSEHEAVFKKYFEGEGLSILVIVMYQLIKMPLLNM